MVLTRWAAVRLNNARRGAELRPVRLDGGRPPPSSATRDGAPSDASDQRPGARGRQG